MPEDPNTPLQYVNGLITAPNDLLGKLTTHAQKQAPEEIAHRRKNAAHDRQGSQRATVQL